MAWPRYDHAFRATDNANATKECKSELRVASDPKANCMTPPTPPYEIEGIFQQKQQWDVVISAVCWGV